ncbi:MAG: hypothetical protein ABI883_02330 [Chthoniobacterales bacterium]
MARALLLSAASAGAETEEALAALVDLPQRAWPGSSGSIGSLKKPLSIGRSSGASSSNPSAVSRSGWRVGLCISSIYARFRLATRYDKLAKTSLAALHLVAAFLILKNS